MSKLIGVIVGPTAAGKTAAGLALCRQYGGHILSADSRQIYRQLRISANKEGVPTELQIQPNLTRTVYSLGAVHQFGLDLVDIGQRFTVIDYQQEVSLLEANCSGPLLMVGGSTLYLDAALLPFTPGPEDLVLRQQLSLQPEASLRHQLHQAGVTPDMLKQASKRRLVRYVEILQLTGQPPTQIPRQPKNPALPWYGIWPEATVLDERLKARYTDQFLAALLAEVEDLRLHYDDQLLKPLGLWVRLTVERLAGDQSDADWRSRLFYDTRAYAKRQLTWWKRYPWIHWFASAEELSQQAVGW